jgi:hypothetical protein
LSTWTPKEGRLISRNRWLRARGRLYSESDYVPDRLQEARNRLKQWAYWARGRVRIQGLRCYSVESRYRSGPAESSTPSVPDHIGAEIEVAIMRMPPSHRELLRVTYVDRMTVERRLAHLGLKRSYYFKLKRTVEWAIAEELNLR